MAPTNDSNPQAGQGRPLPKKESDLFKNVVKHYEMKQYKKAVKQADTILKKFPNHGETLAMKGLVMNCLSKRDEAHELVKLGLMNDMRWVGMFFMDRVWCFIYGKVSTTHFFPVFCIDRTYVGTSMVYCIDQIVTIMKQSRHTNRPFVLIRTTYRFCEI